MLEKNVRKLKQQKKVKEYGVKIYKKIIFTGVRLRFIRYTESDCLAYDYLSNKFLLIGYLQGLMKKVTPREIYEYFSSLSKKKAMTGINTK